MLEHDVKLCFFLTHFGPANLSLCTQKFYCLKGHPSAPFGLRCEKFVFFLPLDQLLHSFNDS